jgi:hypothetical protein
MYHLAQPVMLLHRDEGVCACYALLFPLVLETTKDHLTHI